MNIKKLVGSAAVVASALALQACGGGDAVGRKLFHGALIQTKVMCAFMTLRSGRIPLKHRKWEPCFIITMVTVAVSAMLYSGDTGCSSAKSTGARDPDVIVSNDFYLNTIIPAYNARK